MFWRRAVKSAIVSVTKNIGKNETSSRYFLFFNIRWKATAAVVQPADISIKEHTDDTKWNLENSEGKPNPA